MIYNSGYFVGEHVANSPPLCLSLKLLKIGGSLYDDYFFKKIVLTRYFLKDEHF